jgi:hypothetical protein
VGSLMSVESVRAWGKTQVFRFRFKEYLFVKQVNKLT